MNIFFAPLSWIFCIPFLMLNWLDYYLSRLIFKRGGVELNPVIKIIGLLPMKIGMSILALLLAIFSFRFEVFIVMMIPVLGACIWNVIQLKK